MFKKVLTEGVKLIAGDKGLLTVIKEKTGKISFKRSFAILLLTTIAAPDIALNGLTWQNIAVLAVAGGVYVLPLLFGKKD